MVETSHLNSSDESISLVVDASTSPVQIGIPGLDSWNAIIPTEEHALEGLFFATEKALSVTKRKISEIDTIFFCEGPGSTLSLRIAAAFVRTLKWNNPHSSFSVLSYNALDLASILAPSPGCIILSLIHI